MVSKNKKEVEFIHDISNQVVIAQGGVGFVFSRLKKNNRFEDDELESFQKITSVIENIIKLLQEQKTRFRSQ